MNPHRHMGFTLWTALALLAAGVAAPLVIRHYAQAQRLEQERLLGEQAARLEPVVR